MKERIIYISIILILIIAILFIALNDKTDKKEDPILGFSESCTKTILSNGMMDYKFSYVYDVADDGGIENVVYKQDYEFFVEYQYDQTINNEELTKKYECVDTYSENHKVSCSRKVTLEEATGTTESIWYKTYKKSLETEGYVCNIIK